MDRDRIVGETFYLLFTTRAFATGIPGTLGDTPGVSAIEDDSDTPITAGITLGIDHASVVGLNLLTIVATGANGYEAGKDYSLYIDAGEVDSVSVIGEVVGSFSLGLSAAFTRLGAPAGASVSADNAAIKVDTAATLVDTAVIGVAGVGLTDLGGMSTGMQAEVESEANDALVGQKLDHLVAVAESDDPVDDSIIAKMAASDGDWSGFDETTDALEALADRGILILADVTGIAGAAMRGTDSVVLLGPTKAEMDTAHALLATPAQVNAEAKDVLVTDVMADSVPADGSIPSVAQAVYMIVQFLNERAVSSTTLTVNKVDGSTALMTFTLDSATAPTSITRAT